MPLNILKLKYNPKIFLCREIQGTKIIIITRQITIIILTDFSCTAHVCCSGFATKCCKLSVDTAGYADHCRADSD